MIKTVCVCSPQVVRRNRESAARRGLPWLVAHSERERSLAIVGGGPSAGKFLDQIVSWPGNVMAINGAYDWLLDAGRVPEWACLLDPENLTSLLTRASPRTHWLLASMSDPATFDALAHCPVTIWKSRQGEEPQEEGDIPGGSTAMTRAPVIAAVLGYRDVTLFGPDSCFTGETSHVYGGSHPDLPSAIPAGVFEVECAGRTWLANMACMAQAEYLAEMIPPMNAFFPVRMAGDHLASAMMQSREWKFA